MSLRLLYSPILLRSIAQVQLLNHLPSQDLIKRYNKKWEETFPWLEFDDNLQSAFCKLCKKGGRSLQKIGGAWISKPFTNWKNVTLKMKSHSKSEVHLLSCQLDVEADRARIEGSIISQLQNVGEQQRLQIGWQLKL